MVQKGARTVAIAAAVGNLLQGWDNAAIAGALLYLKPEFHLETNPTLEGLVVASTLIGAVASTAVAGPAADWLGRRFMLCISATIFAISACIMVWSPSVYVLIAGRLFVGTSIGLAATIVPILISESAPTEIRGQLATFPQLMGSAGLFFAYCMVFAFSLTENPNWRLILGIILIPGIVYLALSLFYLPESPRWLVSKGRMLEARLVLQNLRGQEDVSAELALLVEGLGVGVDNSLEEWLLKPADKIVPGEFPTSDEGQITLFGADHDVQWIAQPIKEDGAGELLLSRRTSLDAHTLPLVDHLVSVIGSLQASQDFLTGDHFDHEEHPRQPDTWDEEVGETNGYHSADDEHQGVVGDLDESLLTPFLSKRNSSKELPTIQRTNSITNSLRLSRQSSRNWDFGNDNTVGSMGIGGGWQLAWKADGEEGGYQRVFLLQEGLDPSRFTSSMTLPGIGGIGDDSIQAAALIGPSVQFSKELMDENAVGPATMHPAETATKGPAWTDLREVGVRRALVVGVGLQVLQQFCGINAVLYFTPQILKQSGADVMAESVGINPESASILASAFTCLMMLPCIFLAMWLMDRAGRRQLLLTTLPILGFALVMVVAVITFVPVGLIQALGSFVGVSLFICSFVMGFGPIPNILCSEIFPTRVRGVAIGICSASMWLCNVIVSYSFPIANNAFGLQGVFSFFAVISVIAWMFVFLKVPETKGLPLEIICEFFAITGSDPKKHQHTSANSADPVKKV